MRIVELIERKRDGEQLSPEEIAWFIETYSAGDVPDYQAAALLMAIYFQGMNRQETFDLCQSMANSGEVLDLHDIVPFTVDKHSSGGVGDKTTLVVLPLVVACGVPVGKMSGRGLGLSGGTLDKMESIPGWSPKLTLDQFKTQLAQVGVVLAGQTAELAPADGKLYALRDVTRTVASRCLIASSIMSKKLASGADGIVLDVKVGKGAFMTTVEDARKLARIMVDIGQDAGRQVIALIADMNQPLGHAVGNALEVNEAVETLLGRGPADLWAHSLEIAAHMLKMAGRSTDLAGARHLAEEVRQDGRALAKFRDMVVAQGGDPSFLDGGELLPQAPLVEHVMAQRRGYIAGVDAGAIGWSTVRLGAGRLAKGQPIDHAVGMVVPIKVGQKVAAGDLLGTIHAASEESLALARSDLEAAVSWSDEPVDPLPLFYETVT